MNKERRTVRSIEIDSPIEVKFLDQHEHDIVLYAEKHALQAIGDQQNSKEIHLSAERHNENGDTVELHETIEEDSDQRIKRKIETKKVVSEDPNTKSRITKVTKTETTEVTKVYLIKTNEDVRKAALEFGVSDMSQIMDNKSKPQRSKWTRPHIFCSSARTNSTDIVNEVVTPSDFESYLQGDFVLVGADGTISSPSHQSLVSKKQASSNKNSERRIGSLCNCAGRKRDESQREHPIHKEVKSDVEPPMSIRRKIQESTRRFSAPKIDPLINDQSRDIIQKQNLQLSTYIYDVMCKIGVYQSEYEKNRGRNIISRGLNLLYYNHCKTWPEFEQQMWAENEEYDKTNHIVIPTANVIEYILTNHPDLIGLIDSVPDKDLLDNIKLAADKPFTKLPIDMKSSSEKTYDIYNTGKDKFVNNRTRSGEADDTEKSSECSNSAHVLSIISDHQNLIPKKSHLSDKHLPDVVSHPDKYKNICHIIDDNQALKAEHKSKHKPIKGTPLCTSKCFSCFGDKSSKRKATRKVQKIEEPHIPDVKLKESQTIDAPAVHWPTISVGQTYDTPDIILIEKHPRKLKNFEASPPNLDINLKDKKLELADVDIKFKLADADKNLELTNADKNFELSHADKKLELSKADKKLQLSMDNTDKKIKLSMNDADKKLKLSKRSTDEKIALKEAEVLPVENKLKSSLVETVDVLASGALMAAEMKTDDKYFVSIEQEKQHHLPNIRGIMDFHKCIPKKLRRKSENIVLYRASSLTDVNSSDNLANIIISHGQFQQIDEGKHDNLNKIIRQHRSFPIIKQKPFQAYLPTKSEDHRIGGVCTRCFSLNACTRKQPSKNKKSKKSIQSDKTDEDPVEIAKVIRSASVTNPNKKRNIKNLEPTSVRSQKISITPPSFHLPDIRLSGRQNPFIDQPESLNLMKERLNEVFPGENADRLLNEICKEMNNAQPLDKIRTGLIGRYPLAMIDLVILSMSFVERDFEAGLLEEYQIPSALVKVLEDNRLMYIQDNTAAAASKSMGYPLTSTADTQTILPSNQTKFSSSRVTRSPAKCFSCTSDKKVTVPMSPECITLLESLQKIPSSNLTILSNQISERMRICWDLDKSKANETNKVLKKVLPKLRDGQVASLAVLRNDLKNDNLKYFYVVDPCVDAIQMLCPTMNNCSIKDSEIDAVLHEIGQKYAGVGLLSGSQCQWKATWMFKPDNLSNLIESTEHRIIVSSNDPSLIRKKRKLNKIIHDAYNLMAQRQIANTTDLRSQLQRLHPKHSVLVDLVVSDIEEGLRSGRLQQESGRPSVRILINILHTQDIESCRIQNGDERILSDRTIGNLKRNKDLLASSIKNIIMDNDNSNVTNIDKIRNDEDIDIAIESALHELENIKSFDELTVTLKEKVKHESTAEILSLLLEQAYFASELEDPCSKEVTDLMQDRLHGKPLVLREICFALPDNSTIQCVDHNSNYSLITSPTGKLINVGQGLSWREANERARILFYRGRKPAVRYNDALEGFDVRMILEQDGCVHEIPVSPDDVKRLLNSCGLYWDGLNISLLGKSDEILHRAEQEAFKILRETGFLHRIRNKSNEDKSTREGISSS